MDHATGAQLGIVSITYQTHDEAKKCVAAEQDRNFTTGVGMGMPATSLSLSGSADGGEPRVVLDGEGKLLKLVLGHREERRRWEKERKRLQAQPHDADLSPPTGSSLQTPASAQHAPPPSQNPTQSWRSNHQPVPPHPQQHPLPANPLTQSHPQLPSRPGQSIPYGRYNVNHRRGPPAALVRARAMNSVKSDMPMSLPMSAHAHLPPEADLRQGMGRSPASHSATPTYDRGESRGYRSRFHSHSTMRYPPGRFNHHYSSARTPSDGTPRHSRSPSPIARRPSASRSALLRESEHRALLIDLKLNGFEHVRIDQAQLSGVGATEEDVREFFVGFPVDKVSYHIVVPLLFLYLLAVLDSL